MFSKRKSEVRIADGEVQDLKTTVKRLSASRDHLKKEVIRLDSEIQDLRLRLETTLQFYEIRLDTIYQRIGAGFGSVDEGRPEIQMLPTNEAWEKLIFASKSPYLMPGHIPSPITLSGMRLDTRYATEKLNYTHISGGVEGISVFGPYKRLRIGKYTLVLALEPADPQEKLSFLLDVRTIQDGQERILTNKHVADAKDAKITFEWNLALSESEVEFRIHQRRGGGMKLFGLELRNS